MKKQYILPLIAAGMILTGCSKENPFPGSEGEGAFLKSALAVDVLADGLTQTRAGSDVDIDDFTIVFNANGSSVPFATYRYGDMPEVISLPAGEYTCTATYGVNRPAEWDSPYYLGTSPAFNVVAYEICSYLDPISCRLENVMVSIDFDAMLRSAMSADSYVEVKVGSNNSLNFTAQHADAGNAGFFKLGDERTLVATFKGKVNGEEVSETKSLEDIAKGNHYKVHFKLHNGGNGNAQGDIDGTVTVDASVTIENIEYNVEVGEEPLLDDSERPTEEEQGGSDPGQQDPPAPQAPTITAQAPVNIDAVNDGNSLKACVLNIHSFADEGIIEFTCDIESPKLTPEELDAVGLASHLDLVNPGPVEGPLKGLGFPVNVGGQKDVQFVLTNFLPLLARLGECEHHFILTVTDANGTTTKTLKIKY